MDCLSLVKAAGSSGSAIDGLDSRIGDRSHLFYGAHGRNRWWSSRYAAGSMELRYALMSMECPCRCAGDRVLGQPLVGEGLLGVKCSLGGCRIRELWSWMFSLIDGRDRSHLFYGAHGRNRWWSSRYAAGSMELRYALMSMECPCRCAGDRVLGQPLVGEGLLGVKCSLGGCRIRELWSWMFSLIDGPPCRWKSSHRSTSPFV
ncbi:hypothetical protein F2Q69_00012556 [Brassica cretica]|uniref:Uncharacterized protein n=1 Tax=Brassica cretica TaxID=69181 RepID=A0A8S9R9B5_BRACR|nr:hypothetical protein F2Q69_00012556 [Brassica cretica]